MRNVSKTVAPIVVGIAMVMLLFLTACHRGNTKLAAYPSSKLNPYRGPIKDILPQQVGDYKLVQVSPLSQIDADLTNPTDGAGAIYNSSNNHTVQHLLANFASAADANRELDAALKRYNEAHMNVRVEDIKDPSGQTVGRRIIVKDPTTEAMNWTNGSLYCTTVAYSGYSSDFVRNLPY